MTRQVLLICANQHQAARVQVSLLRYGCMVEVAGTFRRGLAVIKHRPPRAIVLDATLPDLDSHLLAQALAASPACAGLTVVTLPLHKSAISQVIEAVFANDGRSTAATAGTASGQTMAGPQQNIGNLGLVRKQVPARAEI